MPTKVYFQGGQGVTLKGDSRETAMTRRRRGWVSGIAANGHDIDLSEKHFLALEYQTEAEARAEAEAEARKALAQQTASHCRKCGTDSPREFNFCPHCSAPLVKKELPATKIPGAK